VSTPKVRVMCATAGAGALVAMGAVTVAVGAVHEPDAVLSDTPTAVFGATATTTTAPSELQTPSAAPPVTATPPEGFGAP
jgi:hypothetical protein